MKSGVATLRWAREGEDLYGKLNMGHGRSLHFADFLSCRRGNYDIEGEARAAALNRGVKRCKETVSWDEERTSEAAMGKRGGK